MYVLWFVEHALIFDSSDYNYEPASDGSCQLVPGLKPADHSAICRTNPDAIEYYEPTGYRRIPLTTCQGGRELEYSSTPHPCPGKSPEYDRKHRGLSGIGVFFAVVIPLAAATGVGYWVWTHWDGKFGRIRLGEGGTGGLGGVDRESPVIAWPIAILSGVVAVAKATPLLIMSLWRSARGYLPISGNGGGSSGGGWAGRMNGDGARRYDSRGAFARGRGDYAGVGAVEDEDELLGTGLDEGDEEEV